MKEQLVHLKGIGKRVAMLLVLVSGTLFLVSQKDPTYAALDCFSSCDVQYYNPSPNPPPLGCIDTCCVLHSDGTVDCSACSACDYQYGQCAAACFGSLGTGRCRNQTQCQNSAGRFYAQCMANQLGGECLNPDGTVNAPCCNNESVQEYFGCCYP